MNTRSKRGYTFFFFFKHHPLLRQKKPKQNKKKPHLILEHNCYRRKLHHSTVQNVKFTLVWKPLWNGTSPTLRPSNVGWNYSIYHSFIFFKLIKFEYTFYFSGVCRWGPYVDITVITTVNNIAQSTSKANSV